jgi:hypothetical protein
VLVEAFEDGLRDVTGEGHDRNISRRSLRPFILTGISGTVLSVFYVANIVGAVRTARFYNQRQKDLLLGEIRPRSLALEF